MDVNCDRVFDCDDIPVGVNEAVKVDWLWVLSKSKYSDASDSNKSKDICENDNRNGH